MTAELAPNLRVVIERAAPNATGPALDRAAWGLARYIIWRLAALPATSRRGTAPALCRLEQIDEQIMKLAEAFESLGPDELMALRGQEVEVWAALEAIKGAVETAHGALSAAPSVPNRVSKPRNETALAIALRCARVYLALTGSAATMRTKDGKKYGPFLELVAGVFLAANLGAKPEGYARRAVEAAGRRALRNFPL